MIDPDPEPWWKTSQAILWVLIALASIGVAALLHWVWGAF